MKLWEIFRFEISCQARRAWPWVFFAALLGLTLQIALEAYVGKARTAGYFFNAPFVIGEVTFLGSLMGLLVAAAVSGEAATRDVQTRMSPLVYTTPVSRAVYLAGRFLAAFALEALILSAIPAALLLALLASRVEPELIGPFRAAAYFDAYVSIALTNAFIATALLFSMAALSRRAMASYIGAVLLFFATMLAWQFVAFHSGRWGLAKLIDPLGLTVIGELSRTWTPLEKNSRLIGAQGSVLVNRFMWLGIALIVLALTHRRFRFAHHTPRAWGRSARRRQAQLAPDDAAVSAASVRPAVTSPIAVRIGATHAGRMFGFATHVHQLRTVAWESFRAIITSWGGVALAGMAALLVLTGSQVMEHMGVPLFPTTERVLAFLAAPLASPQDLIWMIVPLLIAFYAGELIWREREAGLSDIADAAPVPEWVSFAGKFAGLSLVLVALQALMMVSGILIQVILGYSDFQIGLYAKILFGLQLTDYLLFTLLALVFHVVVNQKYVGHMAVIIAYAFMAFAPALGVEHNLLVYGADPGWSYSDMQGFAASLGPWLWFKFYWTAWALLMAVAAKLLWVRGRELGIGSRIALARQRATRAAIGTAAAAAGLVLVLGGFIFYNTNVLSAYHTTASGMERRAEYERHYGQYAGLAQPRITSTSLNVEMYPRQRRADMRGTYVLVNTSAVAIDAVHLTTSPEVTLETAAFDRGASRTLDDAALGYQIYMLEKPLRPGDAMQLNFAVRFAPRGFANRGIDAPVAANGTFLTPPDWLPAVGYRAGRELDNAGDRRVHGLPARPADHTIEDAAARDGMGGIERMAFAAVVGTDADQIALAPGTLRRTWTDNGRRYFDYAADVPIANDYAVFSAAYAVHDARWHDVAIQILHHPGHAWNVDRMVRSVQASLDYYTAQFGPYPHRVIRLVEYPSDGNSLHSAPVNIWYKEAFSLLHPEDDPRDVDFPFAVVAHEVAHQWWGDQLMPARVDGAPLLTESLAWYSAMAVVEKTYGPEHLRRFLDMMRDAYLSPRTRANVPLLRASDWFDAYRKGPFAMYALREYVGADRVNSALRRLFEKNAAGAPPLPTSLDLYKELQAVTPETLQYLLVDLFEANTFWELAAKQVTARPAANGQWQVTLDVQARKVVVDTAGVETEMPMDDLVEVGVFGAAENGAPGKPLFLGMQRIRSGAQRLTVTVAANPARAGIDPRHLLIDVAPGDNVREITRADAVAVIR